MEKKKLRDDSSLRQLTIMKPNYGGEETGVGEMLLFNGMTDMEQSVSLFFLSYENLKTR